MRLSDREYSPNRCVSLAPNSESPPSGDHSHEGVKLGNVRNENAIMDSVLRIEWNLVETTIKTNSLSRAST
jgi:hypothetical protein